jgi:uncharacterized protein YcbK (DUF882 family)
MPILKTPDSDKALLSRRRFLAGCASLAGLLVTSPVLAMIAPTPQRSLSFRHTHTGERQKICYWQDGEYLAEGLKAANHLLRDHRTGEVTQMDKQLLDLLYALQLSTGQHGEFQIISAYRSPKTNEMLRNKSGGVAKRSLHMQGKAIDIRFCACDLERLRDKAISLKAGGVGYYPDSNFIHVDTGRVRTW